MRIELQLEKDILNEFVFNHPYGHHMKTSFWGELIHNKQSQVRYFGFYEKEQLKATALIIEQKAFHKKYWYIPFGLCVDYQNETILKDVLQLLKQQSVEEGVSFVRIDPNQMRREHLQTGELKEEGFNYEYVTSWIESCGFQHLGYNYGYSGNWQPRFTYILDISQPFDELVKQSYKEIQTYYKKNNRRCLIVEEGERDELKYLEAFGIELSEKLSFSPKSKEYFASIMNAYPNQHLFLVAKAHLQNAIVNIEEDISILLKQVEELSTKVRNQGRIKEITREINNLKDEVKSLQEWQKEEGDIIPVGAALFVYAGEKSFDLYMYSRKSQPNFRAPISLHFKAMELLKQRGVKSYDFVGISGSLNREDPYFGLYDFKRKFGGEFIEYLGEFDLVNNKIHYRFFLWFYKNIRRIQRKILRTRKKNR